MAEEVCYWILCFSPPARISEAPRIFGFAEFISSLALLVITYTFVEVRYRFRLSIAPLSLYKITFGVMGLIGVVTLLTEIWLAQGWFLPNTYFINRFLWQGYFGLLFLVTFMTWVWYAYLRPPIFNKKNHEKYTRALYQILVKGDDNELSVIADELKYSVHSLVKFAPNNRPKYRNQDGNSPQEEPLSEIEISVIHVLELIANRKLCRHIAASSPTTAIHFFEDSSEARKYHIPMGVFAKNIAAEVISNHDSIIYHESDKFSSGLLGHIKPFSQSIFGDYALLEGLSELFGSPLDISYEDYSKWTAQEWKVYCRAVCISLDSYLKSTSGFNDSRTINRSFDILEHAFSDLYKLNNLTSEYYNTDIYKRLTVIANFIRDATEIIAKQEKVHYELRRKEDEFPKDIYDVLADFSIKLIAAASSINSPSDATWTIHHNIVWNAIFQPFKKNKTWKILQYKLRRLLYQEISSIEKLPNFSNAKTLGYCLNVMGVDLRRGNFGREYLALAIAIYPIVQRSYPILRKNFPRVADAVLIGGISYDEANNRLVKTYILGLRNEAPSKYLQLNAIDQGHDVERQQ